MSTKSSEGIRLNLELAHSKVVGRLRVRCSFVRDRGDVADQIASGLSAHPGIIGVDVRTVTGSVIVRYARELTPDAVLEVLKTEIEAAAAGRAPARHTSSPSKRTPHAEDRPWHAIPVPDLVAHFGTDTSRGLDIPQVEARRRRYGTNVMPHEAPPSRFSAVAKQFQTMPVAMLGVSSVVSLATGRPIEAVATLAVVAANAVLGYVTEGQAEASIAALMGSSEQAVSVLRDGTAKHVRSADLVPGDVLLVGAGSQVLADARLVEANRLRVDQSALTGETIPVAKEPSAVPDLDAPIGERPTMLHSGTLITQGQGRAVVVATGAATEAAQIAIASQTGARPRAQIEAELERLSRVLTAGSLAACGLFVVVGLARGYRVTEIAQDAIALAVAAVPEGLPVVSTTTMALALRRMERKGILIRHMKAVEGLGALHTICLDKTGTLTRNRMTVVAALAGDSEVDLTDPSVMALSEAAAVNCDVALDGGRAMAHSSTEQALIDFAVERGTDIFALREAHPIRRTLGREADRPWIATVHDGRGPRTVIKGAPEVVLRMCSRIEIDGRSRPMSPRDRDRIMARNDALAARPARVLGFAKSGRASRGDSLAGLTWLGSLAMADPLRPGARAFIDRMHRAGIDTVMITGDQAATGVAIARELGLGRDGSVSVMDSTELSRLDPRLLAALVRRTDVFARVSAHQKLALVKALQTSGRVVGMTGDGINDAPALKAADIGIAMGESGTDLARDVANVVVRDDRLETLVDAVAEGRAVHRNIRRSLGFLITTNLSEIVVEIVEALHGKGEVETPMELLWINLVTDVLPGLGIAMAAPDEDSMDRPPRSPEEPIMRPSDFRRMAVDGSLISAAALVPHFIGLSRYGPGPQTRGMTFLSLALGQLFYTFVAQRRDISDLRIDRLFRNRALDGAVLASIGLTLLPIAMPGLGKILGIARLGRYDMATSVLSALAPACIVLARRGLRFDLEQIERGG
jgi:P-type Ca2+ transporter type 2C